MIPGVTAAKPPRSNTAFGPGDIYAGARVGILDSASFDKGTSRLAVNYRFTDTIMGYVGYSEGFNSGGFGVEQLSCKRRVSPFSPEDLKNFEVGIRSDLANRKLRLNATVFDTKWNDIQLAGESIDDCNNPPDGVDESAHAERGFGQGAGARGRAHDRADRESVVQREPGFPRYEVRGHPDAGAGPHAEHGVQPGAEDARATSAFSTRRISTTAARSRRAWTTATRRSSGARRFRTFARSTTACRRSSTRAATTAS